jgi:glycogen operon protein
MLLAGDELSHTQNGNNNTYCQDNELTWLNWELGDEQKLLLEFVRKLTRIFQEQPVLHRRKFFQGRAIRGSDIKDISWFEPSGQEMSDEAWNAGFVKCLGVRLAGNLIGDLNERGEPTVGDTLLVLLNAHHEPLPFRLPMPVGAVEWERLFDTAEPEAEGVRREGGAEYPLQGRSLALFRQVDVVEAPVGYYASPAGVVEGQAGRLSHDITCGCAPARARSPSRGGPGR